MKFIRLKSANWMVAMALLALPGALVTSCSKEANPTENVEPKGDKLVVSVLGIKNQSNLSLKGSTAGGNGVSAAVHEVHEFSDVDVAVSVGNNLPVKTVNLASKNRANGAIADVPEGYEVVEEEVKYVVYIYEGTTLVKATELATGTAGTIDGLDPETEYTWVALSYSDKVNAPALNPGATVSLPANEDVLYAKGTVKISEDPSIGVLFDHVYSRIGIELNTMGVFATVPTKPTTLSVTGLNVAAGDLNLLSGALTAGSASALTLTKDDFEYVDDTYQDQLIAYVYTAPSTTEQTASLAVQGLTVSHVDNFTDGNVSRSFFTSQATFPLSVTPTAGQSHHLLVNVVESALETNYGGRTVKWGRHNLYYRGENGPRNYAFYARNAQMARANGYFPFGGVLPGTFATTTTTGDPCALVYPIGLWKSPSQEDFDGVTSNAVKLDALESILGTNGIVGSLVSGLLGTLGITSAAPNSSPGANYAEYNLPTQPGVPASGSNAFGNASNASNKLRFYYNGQVTDATVLEAINNGGGLASVGLTDLSDENNGVIDLDLPILATYGGIAALWSDTQGADVLNLGLVGTGSVGYLGFTQDRSLLIIPLPSRVIGTRTGELLNNTNIAGLNLVSTSLKNVRCVRDMSDPRNQ